MSGQSGTGVVAYGIEWADGRVAYRWTTTPSTTQIADDVAHVRQIHGHGGRTKIVWIDSPRSED